MNGTKPGTAGGLAAGVLMFTLLSCTPGKPIHYYAVTRPPLADTPGKPDGLILVVGRITVPDALQDGRIRYRSGSNDAGAYEYDRWTERPEAIVRDLLIRRLRASGNYRQVQETPRPAVADYLIRGKLHEFSEVDDPAIKTLVSLQLEVVSSKTGLVVWNHDYNRDEPVNGKKINDVVMSLDHNLHQVIADAASGIDSFLSTQKAR